MIIIPNRLFPEDFVTVLLRTVQSVVLKKELFQSMGGRQSYVAKHVLTTVEAGEQRIQNESGETLLVKEGEMAIIRRGLYTVTDLVAAEGCFRAYLVFFDDHLLNDILPSNLHPAAKQSPTTFGTKFTTPSYLTFFWRSLVPWLQEVPTPSVSLQHIKIQEFCALLMTGELASSVAQVLKPGRKAPTRSLQSFMEAHYDKPLSVADYAYLTGRSESTFRREFKARFGVAPRQWIIRQRLEKARRLLQTSGEEVTQVAFEVGYENVSHFISAYKKQYGHTPRQQPRLETMTLP